MSCPASAPTSRSRIEQQRPAGDRLGDPDHAARDPAYDQLLFRPVVAWSRQVPLRDRPRRGRGRDPGCWTLLRRTRLLRGGRRARWAARVELATAAADRRTPRATHRRPIAGLALVEHIWLACWPWLRGLARLEGRAVRLRFGDTGARWATVFGAGLLTLIRVMVLIALASLVWVPIGVWLGLAAGMGAAASSRWRSSWPPFPANLLFPLSWCWSSFLQLNPKSG